MTLLCWECADASVLLFWKTYNIMCYSEVGSGKIKHKEGTTQVSAKHEPMILVVQSQCTTVVFLLEYMYLTDTLLLFNIYCHCID